MVARQVGNCKYHYFPLHNTFFLQKALSHSMEQNPSWEADGHITSQEILCLLWTLKVYYYFHNSPWSPTLHVTFHNMLLFYGEKFTPSPIPRIENHLLFMTAYSVYLQLLLISYNHNLGMHHTLMTNEPHISEYQQLWSSGFYVTSSILVGFEITDHLPSKQKQHVSLKCW